MPVKSKGAVYLVGAGPGDAGLLTLRGAELLRRADTVIYDLLVNPALLRLARADAELISRGKRAEVPQEKINALLIQKAREAKQSRIHQQVVDDGIGVAQQFRAAQREQARVARPGANQINRALGFHRHNLVKMALHRKEKSVRFPELKEFNQRYPSLFVVRRQHTKVPKVYFVFLLWVYRACYIR